MVFGSGWLKGGEVMSKVFRLAAALVTIDLVLSVVYHARAAPSAWQPCVALSQQVTGARAKSCMAQVGRWAKGAVPTAGAFIWREIQVVERNVSEGRNTL